MGAHPNPDVMADHARMAERVREVEVDRDKWRELLVAVARSLGQLGCDLVILPRLVAELTAERDRAAQRAQAEQNAHNFWVRRYDEVRARAAELEELVATTVRIKDHWVAKSKEARVECCCAVDEQREDCPQHGKSATVLVDERDRWSSRAIEAEAALTIAKHEWQQWKAHSGKMGDKWDAADERARDAEVRATAAEVELTHSRKAVRQLTANMVAMQKHYEGVKPVEVSTMAGGPTPYEAACIARDAAEAELAVERACSLANAAELLKADGTIGELREQAASRAQSEPGPYRQCVDCGAEVDEGEPHECDQPEPAPQATVLDDIPRAEVVELVRAALDLAGFVEDDVGKPQALLDLRNALTPALRRLAEGKQ